MIGIVVTDPPLLPAGDLFLALSTANPGAFATEFKLDARRQSAVGNLEFIQWSWMDPIFAAVVQATEEAVVNALVANREMVGRDGHRSPALPHDVVTKLLDARLR